MWSFHGNQVEGTGERGGKGKREEEELRMEDEDG